MSSLSCFRVWGWGPSLSSAAVAVVRRSVARAAAAGWSLSFGGAGVGSSGPASVVLFCWFRGPGRLAGPPFSPVAVPGPASWPVPAFGPGVWPFSSCGPVAPGCRFFFVLPCGRLVSGGEAPGQPPGEENNHIPGDVTPPPYEPPETIQDLTARTAGMVRLHMVFTTKYRLPLLDGDVARLVGDCIEQKARQLGVDVQALAVQPDHVHLVLALPRTLSVARLAKHMKGFSSYTARREHPHLRDECPKALWGRRYFTCSVGSRAKRAVQQYVEKQAS